MCTVDLKGANPASTRTRTPLEMTHFVPDMSAWHLRTLNPTSSDSPQQYFLISCHFCVLICVWLWLTYIHLVQDYLVRKQQHCAVLTELLTKAYDENGEISINCRDVGGCGNEHIYSRLLHKEDAALWCTQDCVHFGCFVREKTTKQWRTCSLMTQSTNALNCAVVGDCAQVTIFAADHMNRYILNFCF